MRCIYYSLSCPSSQKLFVLIPPLQFIGISPFQFSPLGSQAYQYHLLGLPFRKGRAIPPKWALGGLYLFDIFVIIIFKGHGL
jgi:hypothetical protein